MCDEIWVRIKTFIKNITDPELNTELWDEIGPI